MIVFVVFPGHCLVALRSSAKPFKNRSYNKDGALGTVFKHHPLEEKEIFYRR